MNKYILSIDAGTSSSRAVVVNILGEIIGISQYEFQQFFPKNGWVEHDPMEIWNTQLRAIKDVLKKTNINANMIQSIGITNQRETTVIWNKNTGLPVYNAIVWQDRRTADYCDDLKSKNLEQKFTDKTGLLLDPYFSGTKIKWILENDPKLFQLAKANQLAFGTIDSWLIWNLTCGEVHVTDVTNASRTLLFNIHSLEWDQELLNILNIPYNILPKIVSNSEFIAHINDGILGQEIPITAIAGDQQSALFGQMCFNKGDVKNTYGTGCFSMMNTGSQIVKSSNKMLTTVAYQINGTTNYAIEGSVFIAGSLIQWLRDGLGIISKAYEIELLAESETTNGGLTLIPALTGLGAPYWNPDVKGAIFGITRNTSKGHIARAALESIAIRTYEIILSMEKDANIKFSSLKVDGGASNNNLLMQIQSDLLQKEVIRPMVTECTALGVAFMSGLGSGYWSSLEDLKKLNKKNDTFKPKESKQELLLNWNKHIKTLI
ncbi:MAG: glycerol kinase GlpK [Flavobacteriales bacterium]|nr:glycerol kinase GlpK [Flavobacteriales bacterium]